jgi:hypothetical protein
MEAENKDEGLAVGVIEMVAVGVIERLDDGVGDIEQVGDAVGQ